MKKTNREIWDLIFPNQSKLVSERQYEGLQHGGIDWDRSNDKAYLLYFNSHTSREQSRVDVDTIQTGRSSNDQVLKTAISIIQMVSATLAVSSLYYVEFLDVLGVSDQAWVVLLYMVGVMFFLAVAIWFTMENHFVRVDKAWTNSLRGILTLNMPAILGTEKHKSFEHGAVSQCMLSFRQFIKWRRYLTFLHFVLVLFWLSETAAVIYLLVEGVILERIEFVLLSVLVFFQAIVFCRVSYLRWYHTNWRDPTVQLCLALAELDRQLVVAKRPGGPGTAGRGAHPENQVQVSALSISS